MWISRDCSFASCILHSTGWMYKTYYVFSLYKLWESAISHLLALHTLRHGTSPLNYLKIHIYGLVPKKAAQSAGEAAYLAMYATQATSEPREELVYVMKDQNAIPCLCKKKRICTRFFHFSITKRLDPREYAYQSGAAMLHFRQLPPSIKKVVAMVGGILGIFTPTLQFYFDPKDLCLFEPDPWLGCIALRTPHIISASRLGLLGALKVGLNTRVWTRMQDNPVKCRMGLLQLIAAIGITLNGINNNKSFFKLALIHAIFFSAI